MKRGVVIKDNYWWLITESKEVLRMSAAYYKELLNGKEQHVASSSRTRRERWKLKR